MPEQAAAVCIVSGGLDSVCYAATLARDYYDIYMITFAYGQRARREIDAARHFARALKAKEHRIIDISFMKELYGRSNALTDSRQKLSKDFAQNLVVPIRNAIFIAIAGAWAMSINARVVAYGAHSGDVPHYADCRPEFARAMAEALNIADIDSVRSGQRQEIEIMSPAAQGLSKSELLKAGHAALGESLFRTWSCYSNGVKRAGRYVHCGACESCISRKKAFTDAQIHDRTRYAA
ncbi:7-cyano-7-deazaguanine synthase [Nitrososphaera viennensis]|uniref:7-cyano-7-deazaguanine synthase n=2 Tax=Nitrososphaera viennensis TaxID=1034015 RepID=A0A060HPX0_9ARCH|nr:7-cyano-7-deazaguanine synthase [Nitrososphaera viennensis]AIC15601.1 7-cyano-7-deazaguanine synthase [Nitrososphaera viennensis EN76]UVS70476.1 7-cyano-7-deazaguanine synthase [Nitrososphaera viennensis]